MINKTLNSYQPSQDEFITLLETKSLIFSKEVKNIPNEVLNLWLHPEDRTLDLKEAIKDGRQISYKINYELPCKGIWQFRSQFGVMLKKGLRAGHSLNEVLYIKESFLLNIDGSVLYQHGSSEVQSTVKFKSAKFMQVQDARYFVKIKNVELIKLEDYYLEHQRAEKEPLSFIADSPKDEFSSKHYSNRYEVKYTCELIDPTDTNQSDTKQSTLNRYFYRLKVPTLSKDGSLANEWQYKALDVGYVDAKSKKDARSILEEEYGSKICMKSRAEDVGVKNFYLLSLYEPNEYWDNVWSGTNECSVCGTEYTKLQRDKTFDFVGIRSGYCCPECEEIGEFETQRLRELEYMETKADGIHQPCIYKITNRHTQKCYIGQTTQAFTFRWYQHFMTSGSNTKFYEAISSSSVADWIFEVIEIIEKSDRDKHAENALMAGKKTSHSEYINQREQYWINQYNSKENGYNTATADKDTHRLHRQNTTGLFAELEEELR